MEADFVIRDAVRSDLPAIVDIYNSTVPTRMVTADIEPVSVESRESWFAGHSELRPLWVVEQAGQVCGWFSFHAFNSRPAYHFTAEISIYLHVDYRGQGLGRLVLARAIEASPQLKIKTLLGLIFGHNLPSLRLLESFGFQKWAHLPQIAELDGIERDLVIVGKRVIP